MRVLLILILIVLLPSAARGQSCLPDMRVAGVGPVRVAVLMRAGETLKGVLVCVDRDLVTVADGAQIRSVPIADVLRIVKPRDSVLNGFAIGAAIGFLTVGLTCGECPDPGRAVAVATAIMGGIGAGVDALHGSSWTIYSAEARAVEGGPALAVRVRF